MVVIPSRGENEVQTKEKQLGRADEATRDGGAPPCFSAI
jgi:hypothetical protein